MRIIKAEALTDTVKELCIEASCHLPQDVKDAISNCKKK